MGKANKLRRGCANILEALEERKLLAWGAFPSLMDQDLAATNYPQYNANGQTIVALDSGINFNHPALAGRVWTNPYEIPGNGQDDDGSGKIDDVNGWDFIGNDNSPIDDQGHGTMVAGFMAANRFINTGNTRGYSGDGMEYQGIAPGAQVIPLRVANSTSYIDINRVQSALQWIIQNHRKFNITAVNMSIGFGPTEYRVVEDELKTLYDGGVFMAASSGNGGNTRDYLSYPAASPYVVAVGALNVNDTVNSTTSRGPSLDLLAPGNQVPYLSRGADYELGGAGTSYAAPFVAAAGAVIRQVDPRLTPAQILSILKDSGHNVYDSATGLWFKRLDLDSAISLAISRTGVTPLPLPTNTGQTPFTTTPIAVPGTIQLENFDNGGQNVAYFDVTPAKNDGWGYRQDGVDIQACYDTGGGYHISHTRAGEWLEYTIDVNATGVYDLALRVASYDVGGTVHIEIDGHNVSGSLSIPKTGGWNTFTTVNKTGVNLTAGNHVLRLVMDTAGSNGLVGNLNWLKLSPSSSAPAPDPDPEPGPLPAQSPFGGTPIALPGTIQAENFDNGNEGVAYHDADIKNNGGVYRTTGVDIQSTSDTGGGYHLSHTRAGEWLEYTVDVSATGKYDLAVRVASYDLGGKFHIELDGVNVTGDMEVPKTGSWSTWTTITRTGVSLTGGRHVLRLYMDSANASGNVGNFNWIKFTPSTAPDSGSLPAQRKATDLIQAENYSAQSGVTKSNGNLSYVDGGDWVRYDGVDFGSGVDLFRVRIATADAYAGRTIEVRVDSVSGPVIGKLTVQGTGGWGIFKEQTAAVQSISGVHNLYLTFTGGNGVGNIDWFRFA